MSTKIKPPFYRMAPPSIKKLDNTSFGNSNWKCTIYIHSFEGDYHGKIEGFSRYHEIITLTEEIAHKRILLNEKCSETVLSHIQYTVPEELHEAVTIDRYLPIKRTERFPTTIFWD